MEKPRTKLVPECPDISPSWGDYSMGIIPITDKSGRGGSWASVSVCRSLPADEPAELDINTLFDHSPMENSILQCTNKIDNSMRSWGVYDRILPEYL